MTSGESRKAKADNNSVGQKIRFARRRTHQQTSAACDQTNDYYKIRAMLPANFPDKDDLNNSIFVDLLTGSLQREEVRARVALPDFPA